MCDSHLFFIKVKSFHTTYFYSMIYDLDNDVTKKEISNILKDLSINYNLFNLSNSELFITEVTDNEVFNTSELKKYLKNLFFYDKKINTWLIRNKQEPDYNILNIIKKDLSVKLMLIGNNFDYIIRDNKEREKLFDLFESYYHKRPHDVVIYKPTNENGEIEVNDIFNCIPDDKNNIFSIIIQDGYNLSLIKEFSDKSNRFVNVNIFINSNNNYYKVNSLCDELTFKKLSLL